MRIALSVRVSSSHQAQTQTIEQQLERLRLHCQNQGWSFQDEHIFRDDGYSGAKIKRPGLDRLRDPIAQAAFDLVLMTAPDRLARNYVHQVLLLEEFQHGGCQVVFLDRPMSQDPHDQLLLQIRGAVAEYERTLIAERMRRGRQHQYQMGMLLPWTSPPYGYRVSLDHPRDPAGVYLDEMEAAPVREIFPDYLEEGHSLAGLAHHLMQLEVPTAHGHHRWNASSLRGMWTNPTSTGTLYAGRIHFTVAKNRRSALQPVGHHGSSSPAPQEEWIMVGQIPAIISQEQFDQVQAKLAHNQQFARRNNTSYPYLLWGLVSCGICGCSCIGRSREPHAYSTCCGKLPSTQSCREERCRSRYAPAQQLDELVWQDVCEVVQHPDSIAHALQRAQSGEWLSQEWQARREHIRRALAHLHAQMERLTEVDLAGVMLLEEYRKRRQGLSEQLVALDNQARLMEAQSHQQLEVSALCASLTACCQRIALGWEQATFEQKQQLIELLIDRVIVTMEEGEIRSVIPLSSRSEHIHFCHVHTDYFNRKAVAFVIGGSGVCFHGAILAQCSVPLSSWQYPPRRWTFGARVIAFAKNAKPGFSTTWRQHPMDHPLQLLLLPLDKREAESTVRPTVQVLKNCRTGEFYLGTFGDFYVAIDMASIPCHQKASECMWYDVRYDPYLR
jgi:site-specific DNA recombinase